MKKKDENKKLEDFKFTDQENEEMITENEIKKEIKADKIDMVESIYSILKFLKKKKIECFALFDTAVAMATGGLTREDKLGHIGMTWENFNLFYGLRETWEKEFKIHKIVELEKPFDFTRGIFLYFPNDVIILIVVYFDHPYGNHLWCPFTSSDKSIVFCKDYITNGFKIKIKDKEIIVPTPIEEYVRDVYLAVGKFKKDDYFVILKREDL